MTTPDPQRARATFLEGREILERAHDRVAQARSDIESAARQDGRTRMFADSLGLLLRDLASAVRHLEEVTPDELLRARAQYSVDLEAESGAPPPRPDTADASLTETLAWASSQVDALHAQFHALAESSNSEALEAFYAGLEALMGSHQKRIAQLELGLRDL